MSPPAKRARRTSSAESASLAQQEGSESQLRPSVSPNRPTLPPLTSTPGAGPSFPRPSSVIGYTSAQSDWSSAWPHGHNSGTGRAQSRRSMDAKSPVSPMSPKMEGIEETSSTESGLVFTRDASNRAPRSMIACTRCRRQKMKCDGPTQVPCRGCRQSGQPCVFEARSRPKSISVLPSRAPPFYPGRPPTPGGGGNAALGFYPSGAQPAPPTLSRGAVGPPGSSGSIMSQASESYAIRAAREPMPPPPATSISVLTSPYPPAGNVRPPTPVHPPGPTLHSYHPAPLQFPPLSATTGPGPPLQPPLQRHASPPMASTSSSSMGSSVNPEARLRAVESAVRGLSSVPSSINQLQHSLSSVHRAINSLASSVHSVVPRPPGVTEVAENVWEDYRSRAWPLTPWLIGLRESRGLPMLVVDLLGKRTVVDKSEHGRVVYEDALRAARSELGRLITVNSEWTREEIRALGAFATWTNDSSLASLAISNGRLQGLDRIWSAAKSHDDWREWIYLTIMDHLCQLVDLNNPITPDVLSTAWRERLSLNSPSTGSVDVAVRDRDHKLLAWLEYTEMIAEVLRAHNVLKRDVAREESTQRAGVDVRAADAAADIWRRYGTRWDAWAGVWSARSDPILSLHFNYAILYTSTPVIFGREGIWAELSLGIEGRALLERGRDAAVAVIQAICSPEISRTIVYSFTLYRPILALALLHLGHLALLPASPSGLSSTPVITPARVLDIFRGTYEAIYPARPLDIATSSSGLRPDIALAEIVERGDIGIISRLTSNVEPGRDLWRKLLG